MYSSRYLVENRTFYKSWLSLQKVFAIKVRNYNNIDFEDIPDVTPASIKRILKQNSISFEEGYTSFITYCLLCGKQVSNGAAKLPPCTNKFFINKTTGNCLAKGGYDWCVTELSLFSF